MISAIAAILIGVWFYNTAPRSGRAPFPWAVSGVILYFVMALLWSMGVTPSIKDAASHSQGGLMVWVVRYAYIVFGVSVAVALNQWLNKPSGD